MKIFCIGDIHGNFKGLKQALQRSNFDNKTDQLICLGDIADGLPDVKNCFDLLMGIKNLIFILGNHDKWFMDWLQTGNKPKLWVSQGGANTIKSFKYPAYGPWVKPDIAEKYLKFLKTAIPYHIIEDKNFVFVHGGFEPSIPISAQSYFDLTAGR